MTYHLNKIEKGTLGEFSKIEEEVAELKDALEQDCLIMALVELSDIYGAIEAFLETYTGGGITMDDLKIMSDITKRAFASGERK